MKRLEITESLRRALIAKGMISEGESPSGMSFYQFRTLSTETIKQNSVYNYAKVTPATLEEIARLINEDKRNTPIQTMHDTRVLPVGRAVQASTHEDEFGVRALYVNGGVSEEHPELVNKVDTGIIDEVSINFMGKHLYCSACNKDVLDHPSGPVALMFGFCPHCEGTLGTEECNLTIDGVKSLHEISLVGQGAAKNPKILDKAKHLSLAANAQELKVGLSNLSTELQTICLGYKQEKEDPKMEKTLEELVAQFKILADKIGVLEAKFSTEVSPETPKEDPKTETPKEEPKTEAPEAAPKTEAPEAAPKTEAPEAAPVVDTEKEEMKASLSKLKSFAIEEVNKVLVAAGKTKLSTETSTVEDMKKALSDSSLTLAASIPAGGASMRSDKEVEVLGTETSALSAFKTR